MKEIETGRLILRPFRETDYDDLYEFLSQLRDDEFEGYPTPYSLLPIPYCLLPTAQLTINKKQYGP